MDGRLEVPDRLTFETYVRLETMLNEGRGGWDGTLRRLDEPLVLLDHVKEFGAEATLLADPGWRCIFFDAVASIFVSKSRNELEAAYPSVDFAARHFHDAIWQAVPPEPNGIAEGNALLLLAWTLEYRDGLSGSLPISILLPAGQRFRQAIAIDRSPAASWASLGMSCWNMIADLKNRSPGPTEPWDIARGIFPAQATYCFRRALELDPAEPIASSSLLRSLESRGMRDPARALVQSNKATNENDDSPVEQGTKISGRRLARRVAELLAEGLFDAVPKCYADALAQGIEPDWATSDRVAATLLHLGEPAAARQIWERATDAPSAAVRLSRIATAELASAELSCCRSRRL